MITHVGTVSVFVENQDRAKAFYTSVLGFELHGDEPIFPGAQNRWLTVAPQGAKTEIILYLPDENWQHYQQVVGKLQALTLEVNGLVDYVNELKGKGVQFANEPEVQPWGTFATLIDSEGNRILLVEQPKL
ncbi:MAG: glyoxalase superfamily protein [bacterium]|nr:glyoxalase superfamily protein [bacterium]